MANASGNYTVVVDGQKFNVTIAEGNANIQVTPVATTAPPAAVVTQLQHLLQHQHQLQQQHLHIQGQQYQQQ